MKNVQIRRVTENLTLSGSTFSMKAGDRVRLYVDAENDIVLGLDTEGYWEDVTAISHKHSLEIIENSDLITQG